MKTRFSLAGHYRLRLDHIQPKEAKPVNRIHLNFGMLLIEDEMSQAPTQIRKVYQLISDPELEIPKAMIATKIKGIDIEIFPTPPVTKSVPVLVTLSNCILRDIQIHRLKKGEVKLYFSVGIAWDTAVWRWGGEQVFMECFAKFFESQSTLLDESEADESLNQPPAATQLHASDPSRTESLALSLAQPEEKSRLAGGPPSAEDPLKARSKRGRPRNMKLIPPRKGKNNAHARV